jgi:flavin reductase (DIM6/NTAB) family NADH-FMN oxidoreductase RutF
MPASGRTDHNGGSNDMTNQTTPAFDKRELRAALGKFGTGVTVITTRRASGELVGLTASSFNSVSLDPALVLWSLSSSSPSMPAFLNASHFTVNVLALEQVWLSKHFSMPQADKFAGVKWSPGLGGAPVIEGCTAQFECRNEFHHEGGDHLILVGRVERFSYAARPPLLFCGGKYFTGHPIEALAPVRTAEDTDDSDWAGIG